MQLLCHNVSFLMMSLNAAYSQLSTIKHLFKISPSFCEASLFIDSYFRLHLGRISSYLQRSSFFTWCVSLHATRGPGEKGGGDEGPRFSSSLTTQDGARPPCSPRSPRRYPGRLSQLVCPAPTTSYSFPHPVIYGLLCPCVHACVCVWHGGAFRSLELVHCPASSRVAAQRSVAANLQWPAVTYFRPAPAG